MKRVIGINLLLGIWLLVSPFVLGLAESAYQLIAAGLMVGVVCIICSGCVMTGTGGLLAVSRLEAACGMGLALAPHVLQYPAISPAAENDVIAGVILLMVSVVQTT